MSSPPCHYFHRVFADVDDLLEQARHWDLDFRQLDCGQFAGQLLQYGAGGVQISDAQFGRRLRQKGTPPVGLRTVAVPAREDLRLAWRGHQVAGNDLLLFPEGDQLDSVSGPDFHVYTCSFPEAMLDAMCQHVLCDTWHTACANREVIHATPMMIARLRSLLRALSQNVADWDADEVRRQLTYELPRRLVGTVATSPGSVALSRARKREVALARAERFIEAHLGEDIRVVDVCRAAGVSQRTLEYAFSERFGITPKAYIRAHRLAAVRRGLRAVKNRQATVAAVANAYGFWHMGQFAADYRKQFDELPSQTMLGD